MLNAILFLVQLLPIIHQVVLAVERMFPGAGQGAAKLDAAVQLVQGFLPALGVTPEKAAQLAAPLPGAISAVVGVLNSSGAWTTKDGAPITAPGA